MQSILELKRRQRQGGGGKTERSYLDFTIDGVSVHDMLAPGDVIGCTGWGSSEAEKHQIAQLLLKEKPGLDSGRVAIYICPECGDLGCGAVTVSIQKAADSFVWSYFAFETDTGTIRKYENVGPFFFDKILYWQAINTPSTENAA